MVLVVLFHPPTKNVEQIDRERERQRRGRPQRGGLDGLGGTLIIHPPKLWSRERERETERRWGH